MGKNAYSVTLDNWTFSEFLSIRNSKVQSRGKKSDEKKTMKTNDEKKTMEFAWDVLYTENYPPIKNRDAYVTADLCVL